MSPSAPSNLTQLRQHIQRLDGSRRVQGVLPFGVSAIDNRLPGGGLALGALHEVAGCDGGATDGAAAALFVAGIAARHPGKVLWCLTRPDLFAPGLAQVGLDAGRVIYVESGDEKSLLSCCEEAVRQGSLGTVVAEVGRLSLLASRRLQLAAEGTSTLALALRRWGQANAAVEFGLPTSAVTRWRVASAPSQPNPAPGVMGIPRWRLELLRCKGGETAEFMVEACNGQGRLALSAPLVHRPAAAATESESERRAAS